MIPGPRSYSLGGSRIDRFRRLGEVSLKNLRDISTYRDVHVFERICWGLLRGFPISQFAVLAMLVVT